MVPILALGRRGDGWFVFVAVAVAAVVHLVLSALTVHSRVSDAFLEAVLPILSVSVASVAGLDLPRPCAVFRPLRVS